MSLNKAPTWSATANGILCSVIKPVTFTSSLRTWLSNGLDGFRKIESIPGCFLFASCALLWGLPLMCLVMSAQPWCSMLMSFLRNVQYKLCSVFFRMIFLQKGFVFGTRKTFIFDFANLFRFLWHFITKICKNK